MISRKTIMYAVAVMIAAIIGVFAAPAHAAPAARSAPAVKSMAATVPPGCHTSWDVNTSTYVISTGATVSVGAIHSWSGPNGIAWSTSGASAGLDKAFVQPNDTKAYQISVHRYENNATHYNGPSAVIKHVIQPLVWDPSPPLWLTNNSILYEVAGYDVNRPAVGFEYFQPSCG